MIEEYVKTGRSSDYESLAASVPAGLIPLMQIPSLGPKTIGMLWRERGLTDMAGLVQLLDSGGMGGTVTGFELFNPGARDFQVKERPSCQSVIVQTAFGRPGCSTV